MVGAMVELCMSFGDDGASLFIFTIGNMVFSSPHTPDVGPSCRHHPPPSATAAFRCAPCPVVPVYHQQPPKCRQPLPVPGPARPSPERRTLLTTTGAHPGNQTPPTTALPMLVTGFLVVGMFSPHLSSFL
jgi:hypothetical protein